MEKDKIKNKILDRYFDQVEEPTTIKPQYETVEVVNEVTPTYGPTIVSEGAKLVGNLKTESDVEIYGSIEGNIETSGMVKMVGGHIAGNIKANSVLIRNSQLTGDIESVNVVDLIENTTFNGNITCKDLVVNCDVIGNVLAKEKIYVMSQAHIKGDVTTKIIKVDEGGVIQGRMKMK